MAKWFRPWQVAEALGLGKSEGEKVQGERPKKTRAGCVTPEQAREIIRLRAAGVTLKDISRRIGFGIKAIHRVLKRRR